MSATGNLNAVLTVLDPKRQNTWGRDRAIVLAFGFSGAVGIFFGFSPAREASRLDPIEALRDE